MAKRVDAKRAAQHGAQRQRTRNKFNRVYVTRLSKKRENCKNQEIFSEKSIDSQIQLGNSDAKQVSNSSDQIIHTHLEEKIESLKHSQVEFVKSMNSEINAMRESMSREIKNFNKENEELRERLREKKSVNNDFLTITNSGKMVLPNKMPNEKEIFEHIQLMPKFAGSNGENFHAWVLNTKMFLSRCPSSSEEEKKLTVLLKLEGSAREIVDSVKDISSAYDIFKALEPTYGQDHRTILASTLQMPGENVKIYLSRLKTSLRLIGFNNDSQSQNVLLDYFVKGLQPALLQKVKIMMPQRIEDAVGFALQVELDQRTLRN